MSIDVQLISINNTVFKDAFYFDYAEIKGASKETYRIIKAELLRMNNQIDAYYFQGKELGEHYKTLKGRKKAMEKSILWLNKISNRFGQDYWQGIKFTAFVSIMFYTFYLYSLEVKVPCGEIGKNYFEFFIVTHKLDFMSKYNPRAFSYLLDTFGRIAISYGLVQTVQAFRKHSKGGS